MKAKHVSRLLSLLLALAMVIGMMVVIAVPSAAAEAEEGDAWSVSKGLSGSGTEEDPYLITNTADFGYFYNNISADDTSFYKLTADLTYASTVDLGNGTPPSFGGTLDGDGHTIRNLKKVATSSDRYIFGTVSGTIRNLTIDSLTLSNGDTGVHALIKTLAGGAVISDLHIQNMYLSGGNAAGLAGDVTPLNDAAILVENCSVQGTINVLGSTGNGSGGYFMCLSSQVDVTIRNCTADLTVSASGTTAVLCGGMIGYLTSNFGTVTLENDVVTGTCTLGNTSSSSALGGMIGKTGAGAKSTGIRMTGCVNQMSLTAAKGAVGGLVGFYGSKIILSITSCANYGDINITTKGSGTAGGFVGAFNNNSSSNGDKLTSHLYLYNCANYGNIIQANIAGGVVGEIYLGTDSTYGKSLCFLTDTVLAGDVNSVWVAGGVVGRQMTTSSSSTRAMYIKLTSCALTGKVSGSSSASGLFIGACDDTNGCVDPIIEVDANSYVKENVNCSDTTKVPFTANTNNSGSFVYLYESSFSKYTPATWSDTVLTDGTAVSTLNTNATSNGYMLWVQGDKAPELMSVKLTLTSASLSLGGEMTLNMKLDATKLPSVGTPSSISIINGTTAYAGTLDESTQTYIFPVTGIAASDLATEMNFRIVVTLNDKEYTTIIPKTYSVLTYAENVYKSGKAGTYATQVLESLVVYAYAAEVNRNGSSTILDDFNAKTGANLTYDLSAYDAEAYARTDVDGSNINSVATVAASLSSGVNLVFKVTDATVTQLKVSVNDATYTYNKLSDNTITVTDLHAGMLRSKLTLTFVDADGATVTSATYAIGNYLTTAAVASEYTDAQRELAKATALYMYAVRAYAMNG